MKKIVFTVTSIERKVGVTLCFLKAEGLDGAYLQLPVADPPPNLGDEYTVKLRPHRSAP